MEWADTENNAGRKDIEVTSVETKDGMKAWSEQSLEERKTCL